MQERLKFMSILTTAAWLAQLGDRAERRSAEREVTGSNPGRTNTQGPVSQHLHLSGSLWDVKEPTPLFEKSRGRRPQCCGQPSHFTSFTSWVGWVQ